MVSLLPSVLILGAIALAAVFVARSRSTRHALKAARAKAAAALMLATAAQSLHFAEEAATGFHRLFPALFGLPEMPFALFTAFNLLWIGIWIASVKGIRSGSTAAYFAAWFLALAGIGNAISHPLFAIATGGYFPGLFSAPVIGAASVWLSVRLLKATESIRG